MCFTAAPAAAAPRTILASMVLALSVTPLALVEATTGARLTLAAMHIAVGAVLITGLHAATATPYSPPVTSPDQ